MEHQGFFERAGPFRIAEVAHATGATLPQGCDPSVEIHDVRPLQDAKANELTFFDNRKYLPQLAGTVAAACLVLPALAEQVPQQTRALTTKAPYRGFALAMQLFYPDALRPKVARPGLEAPVDPSAELEKGVEVEPGAIIGPQACIGRGTRIAAGAVVGYRCTIGRNCYIGPQASITHTMMGNGVIVHAGVRMGQDGFGFAMGAGGHLKVPQIGRVIVQDNVEIGANSAIDRGALNDTIIGEGTKIDNLVQIGHNVVIGRHCVIVAQTGISGSTQIEDFVVMGGQAGAVGHIRIGRGAQIAGASHVKNDVPAGARMGGTPARPFRQWAREIAVLERLYRRTSEGSGPDEK